MNGRCDQCREPYGRVGWRVLPSLIDGEYYAQSWEFCSKACFVTWVRVTYIEDRSERETV